MMTPQDIDCSSVLAVCASQKGRGDPSRRSALRGILVAALEHFEMTYPRLAMLDLADCPLPVFEGKAPEDSDSAQVKLAFECVARCGALLVGVPAYWSSVSGAFKNLVEILCGPAYDLPADRRTVFADKPVGVLVVGADRVSAARANVQSQQILSHVGATVVGDPIVVANPRSSAFDAAEVISQTAGLLAEVTRRALSRVPSSQRHYSPLRVEH